MPAGDGALGMRRFLGAAIGLVVASLLAVTLSGCSQKILTSIESFQNLPPAGGGRTIAILPGSKEKPSELEFNTYSSKLAAHLEGHGYRVVPAYASARPDYALFFAYGVDDGQLVSRTYAIPQYGVTGYSGSHTRGTINTYGRQSTYNATTVYSPQYGITGYTTGVVTDKVFTRAVVIDMYDTTSERQVYSGKLISSGACSSISGVLDALLEALFQDFPGPPSGSRTVSVRNNANC
jgi:hypothetical protein